MKITEVQSKSALVKSALPDTDFVVNPYSGCAFGCVYCYADFMRRFSGHLQDRWGEYVDVRVNVPGLLNKELDNLIIRINKGKAVRFKGGTWPIIFISSVTDPYQGVEAKYKLTRQCLQILADHDFRGEVAILTKSHLITRDIDILEKLHNVTVGLTITSTDDQVGRFFEKYAPHLSKRIDALKKLNKAGIKTYAFVGPLLPHYAANEKELGTMFKSIRDAGTNEVYVEHINLPSRRMSRLKSELKGKISSAMLGKFYESQTEEYKQELNELIYKLLDKYKLRILGGGIIDHKKIIGKGTKFMKK